MDTRTQKAIELRQQRKTLKEIGAYFGVTCESARLILKRVGIRGYLPPKQKPPKATKEEVFWSHMDRPNPDDCWAWKLGRHKFGYGKIHWKDAGGYAHRMAWIYTNGDIPDGLDICHKCDNPPCCNPAHLFLGTHKENMNDRDAKGRNNKGKHIPHNKRHHIFRKCSVLNCTNEHEARGLCNMHYKRIRRASGEVNW